MIINYKKKDSV